MKVSKAQVKFLKSLHQKKYRNLNRAFIAEGEKISLEALESEWPLKVGYCTSEFAQKYADRRGVKALNVIEEGEFRKISYHPQPNSALLVLSIPEPDLNWIPDESPGNYYLILDRVQDPGNLGTIIRVADWYGIRAVICSEDTVEQYNPKVIAATMGSFLRVPLYYQELKSFFESSSLRIYGARLEGDNLHKLAFVDSAGIFLGNESKGISPEFFPYITHSVHIPCFGKAESLNVAMASAIICDNVRRQIPLANFNP